MERALLVALVIVLIILEPLVAIWALNTLFGLGIEFTGWTWLAALALGFIMFGGTRQSKK